MSKKYNICLDIGGTKVLGAVFNEKDKLICKVKRRSTEEGAYRRKRRRLS